MGIVSTYAIEDELRHLVADPKANGDRIYKLVKIIAGRIIYKNPSKTGSDVNHRELAHEIAADITTRLITGSLSPIDHWSGYIDTVLPRFVKNNAKYNSPQIINTYKLGIDPKNIIDANHAGSVNLAKNTSKRELKLELENIVAIIDKWILDNVRYIDRNSSLYENLKISIKLSLIKDEVIPFRVDKSHKNLVILYTNKLKIFLAKMILENQSENPYDQLLAISDFESLEEINSGGNDQDD